MIEHATLEAEKRLRRELTDVEAECLQEFVREDLTQQAIEFAVVLCTARDQLGDAA
ncbi:hypothetical protein [Shimia thalassica]|uniref:hypothetical protein n=1 Tax=Shimia thalassica TaxID=1715693 RepID=UPI002736CA78|nr:hypothetical protein [Shimia thalassica]MDP2518725.1 hypothetical protein [Shimia thalassica]